MVYWSGSTAAATVLSSINADQLEETNVPVTRLTRGLLPALAIATALGAALTPAAAAAPTTAAATTDLTISVYGTLTPVVREYRLTCDPDGGTHPRPKEACEAIRKSPGTIKPPPPTANCLDRVYGPEYAKVSGVLFGVEVAAGFNRRNSCEEDRWQAWLPVWG
ncbi:SSI family serine proteinase inhibitor [Saccharothrix carnea]|uniref:SSI family serine proteinase inhibitor n=1 Tax=Saccharothrix carnea TaxID=1280637 RepID=UPI0015E6FBD9|nr:SSI family serine proteinase inhibitor [Saccharothrix carnea]